MTSYVSAELRRIVEARAEHLCEYCLVHESDMFLGCQVDHVIAEKHGGATDASNLCLACTFCNRAKGSDIGSLAENGEFTRFFNPRTDQWCDHFTLIGATIVADMTIAEVTASILEFNSSDRLFERTMLANLGRYPSATARQRLKRN